MFSLHTVELNLAYLGRKLHGNRIHKKVVHITQSLAHSRCLKDILGRKEERARGRTGKVKKEMLVFKAAAPEF